MSADEQREILTILHISDLHVKIGDGSSLARTFEKAAAAVQNAGSSPDALVISGDLAHSGAEPEYKVLAPVLQSLLGHLRLAPERTVIVPGNHDLDQSQIDAIVDSGLDASFGRDRNPNWLWSQYVERGLVKSRFANFLAFAEASGFTSSSRVLALDNDRRLGVLLGNSAWRSHKGEDKDRLVLALDHLESEWQAVIRQEPDLRIAVLHHPVSWLHDETIDGATQFLRASTDIFMHGHRHEPDAAVTTSTLGSYVVSSARGASNVARPGFQILTLDFNAQTVELQAFVYNERRREFVPDADLANDGRSLLAIRPRSGTTPHDSEFRREIIAKTKKHVDASRNQIASLCPVLNQKGFAFRLETHVETAARSRLSTAELVAQGSNVLVCGPPQCGRTMLLGAIAETIRGYGGIAVVLPASKATQGPERDPVRILATALEFSRGRVTQLLALTPTLLIDDVEPDSIPHKALLGACATLGIRVIATTRRAQSDLSPVAELFDASRRPQIVHLPPVSFASIRKLFDELSASGAFDTSMTASVAAFVQSSLRRGLPRAPWLVAMCCDMMSRGQSLQGLDFCQIVRLYVETRLSVEARGRGITPRFLEGCLARLANDGGGYMSVAQLRRSVTEESEATGISCDFVEVIQCIVNTGLVTIEGESACFSYPVFHDYFRSRHILFHGIAIEEISVTDLVNLGGTLAFVAAERRADDLVVNCFETVGRTLGPAGLEHALDDSLLLGLDSLPHDLAEGVAESLDRRDAAARRGLSDEIEESTSPRVQRPVKPDLEAEPDPKAKADGLLLTEAFMSATSVLRAGTRLSSDVKRLCVSEAVSCSITVVNLLLRRGVPALAKIFDANAGAEPRPPGGPEPQASLLVHAVLTAILAQTGNMLLAMAGADRHLANTIAVEFSEEADHSRRFVLLTWHSTVDPDGTSQLVDAFVAARPGLRLLSLAQHWFLLHYAFTSTLDATNGGAARECLRKLVSAVLAAQGARRPDARAKQIDEFMRSAETLRKTGK